jgi:hypothetical protein
LQTNPTFIARNKNDQSLGVCGLRWLVSRDCAPVRQQWNFSPLNSTRDVEDYRVELSGFNVLELVIVPDIGGEMARASLKSLRVS